MKHTIKPILSSDKGTNGVYIDNKNKLYYNKTPLLDAARTGVRDIIDFSSRPVSISILKKVLKAYGFDDLINSLVIYDYKNPYSDITFDLDSVTFNQPSITFNKNTNRVKKLFSVGMGFSYKNGIINFDSRPVTYDDDTGDIIMKFDYKDIEDKTYIIAVGGKVRFLYGEGNRIADLKSLFEERLSELNIIFSRIDPIYTRIALVQNETDLPIQLLPKGHISDYVSFEHLVTDEIVKIEGDNISIMVDDEPTTLWLDEFGNQFEYLVLSGVIGTRTTYVTLDYDFMNLEGEELVDGKVPILFSERIVSPNIKKLVRKKRVKVLERVKKKKITFEKSPMHYYDDEDDPNAKFQYIWFSSLVEVPDYEPIVREDDVLDIVIGYTEPDKGSLETLVGTDGEPMTFDRYQMTYGNYPLFYISSIIQVKEVPDPVITDVKNPTFMRLGDKFLIEVSSLRLIVYPISSEIGEYFIKSCRLIKREPRDEIPVIPDSPPPDSPPMRGGGGIR